MVKDGGIVTCMDAATGEQHYRRRLGASGVYYSSPIAADGVVYAAAGNGTVVAFAAGDRLQVLARNALGESISATPAAVDGTLYVRTSNHLYAFARR
jgi:outer membrane protein assembly factor BamB